MQQQHVHGGTAEQDECSSEMKRTPMPPAKITAIGQDPSMSVLVPPYGPSTLTSADPLSAMRRTTAWTIATFSGVHEAGSRLQEKLKFGAHEQLPM